MRCHQLQFVALTLVGIGLAGTQAPASEDATVASSGLTRAEQEHFLLNARILEMERIPVGVTGSSRATLTDGVLTHDAHIQTVDIHKQRFEGKDFKELDHKDCYKFNIAAYRLDKLLGLGMVPVAVKRTVAGERAAVTWWVDDCVMTAAELLKTGAQPPDADRFRRQKLKGWAFQNLVHNTDPNQGNFLIDAEWNYWMVDFSRAFRRWKKLIDVENLNQIPRSFYSSLQELDPGEVKRELSPCLTGPKEIQGIMARRDLLLQHFQELMEEQGEAAVVLEDLPDGQ